MEETRQPSSLIRLPMNNEIAAVISMAIHEYRNEVVHDNESYIITIQRPSYRNIINFEYYEERV